MQLKTVEEVAHHLYMGTHATEKDFYEVLIPTITQDRQDTITAVIGMVEGMKTTDLPSSIQNPAGFCREMGRNQALTDIITKLQALSPKE